MANNKEYPEEGDLALCTVEKIFKTTVFVKLDDYNKNGVIPTSEISPGRIRNIRDYVTINKKIICKVLRVDKFKGHIDLSLRRVSLKDRKELLEKKKKEKGAEAILTKAVKTKVPELIINIKKEYPSLFSFLEAIKENSDVLKKFITKEDEAKQLISLISEKIKEKKVKVKAKIKIEGLNDLNTIKNCLKIENPKISITYISAPNYLIMVEGDNYKDSNKLLEETLEEIEKKIKKAGGEFESEIE